MSHQSARTVCAAVCLSILTACAHPPEAEPEIGHAAAPAIDAYLGLLEGHDFSGVVLIARGGSLILERGSGLADRERQIAVTPESARFFPEPASCFASIDASTAGVTRLCFERERHIDA